MYDLQCKIRIAPRSKRWCHRTKRRTRPLDPPYSVHRLKVLPDPRPPCLQINDGRRQPLSPHKIIGTSLPQHSAQARACFHGLRLDGNAIPRPMTRRQQHDRFFRFPPVCPHSYDAHRHSRARRHAAWPRRRESTETGQVRAYPHFGKAGIGSLHAAAIPP